MLYSGDLIQASPIAARRSITSACVNSFSETWLVAWVNDTRVSKSTGTCLHFLLMLGYGWLQKGYTIDIAISLGVP